MCVTQRRRHVIDEDGDHVQSCKKHSGSTKSAHETVLNAVEARESHVYSFTFAKRPQLGIKPKSNINSLNPGGERMNERECVRVRVYGRNGDGDGA